MVIVASFVRMGLISVRRCSDAICNLSYFQGSIDELLLLNMTWTKRTALLLFLIIIQTASAQNKLLSLEELSNCKIYSLHFSDTLKTNEAYLHGADVYAIHYHHEPYHTHPSSHAESAFPFTATDFPNLQFLIIGTAVDIPSNLAQFQNLQVLFLVDEIDSLNYPPGDVEDEVKSLKPVLFPEEFYDLHQLKVFYSNAHMPSYHYGAGTPTTLFYFDPIKLASMKSLELIDMPDGFMDNKLISAFFCPNLKVLIQSDIEAFFLSINDNLSWDIEKHPPQIHAFKKRQGNLLLVNDNLHGVISHGFNSCYYPESEVLKSYDQLLKETTVNPEPVVKNQLTICENPLFDYRYNLVVLEGDPPVLEDSSLMKDELFALHTGFTDSKIGLLTTCYYFPKTGAYLFKTSFHNGRSDYSIQLKSCYPLANKLIKLQVGIVHYIKHTTGKGRNKKVSYTIHGDVYEDWTRYRRT